MNALVPALPYPSDASTDPDAWTSSDFEDSPQTEIGEVLG